MIRHQEYSDRRERRRIIPYHDNLYIPTDWEDIQLLAMRQALLKLKDLHSDKFEVLIGFYYGNYKTIKAYAVTYGISRQAMSKSCIKLWNCFVFYALKNLRILKTEYEERTKPDCCNFVTNCDDLAIVLLLWLRLFRFCAKIERAILSLSV